MRRSFRTLFRLYRAWLALVAGYLLGSVLSADVLSRATEGRTGPRVDLRATGSGNPGAGNALTNLGRRWGAVILAGDIVKGGAAAQAGRAIAGDAGAYLAATGAVAGHCFPAWSGFRGGKGVATTAGTTLVCFPAYIPAEIAVYAAGWARWRHPGKATAAASLLFVACAALWAGRRLPNAWGTRPTLGLPLYAAAATALIAYRFLAAPPHMGDRAP